MRIRILLFAGLVALAACQGRKEESAPAEDTTSTLSGAIHPGSPGGTAVVPDVTAGTTILVMLEDRHIAVRKTAIPPGPAVFTVTNGGSELHNLSIEGPGVSTAAGDPIAANGSRSVAVTLQPGTYTLYCPILDHREKGEQATITVRR